MVQNFIYFLVGDYKQARNTVKESNILVVCLLNLYYIYFVIAVICICIIRAYDEFVPAD